MEGECEVEAALLLLVLKTQLRSDWLYWVNVSRSLNVPSLTLLAGLELSGSAVSFLVVKSAAPLWPDSAV